MTEKTSEKTLIPATHTEPVVFTRDQLDWLPWLEPMAESAQIGAGKPLIEQAEPFLDHCDDVDNAIWGWRIGSHRIPLGDWLTPHRARPD